MELGWRKTWQDSGEDYSYCDATGQHLGPRRIEFAEPVAMVFRRRIERHNTEPQGSAASG